MARCAMTAGGERPRTSGGLWYRSDRRFVHVCGVSPRMEACVDVHPKTTVACIYICMYPHTIVGRYLSTMCCVCCHSP